MIVDIHLTTLVCSVSMALALAVPATAAAGAEGFDRQMSSILPHYLTIQAALARDTTDGVREAAQKLAQGAEALDSSTVTGEHREHYAHVPKKIRQATSELLEAGSLEAARDAFKRLSRPFAMWASMSEPNGVYVMYCSMAKGSWLQKDDAIRNPYHGSSMLTCGEVVSGHSSAGGHGHGH